MRGEDRGPAGLSEARMLSRRRREDPCGTELAENQGGRRRRSDGARRRRLVRVMTSIARRRANLDLGALLPASTAIDPTDIRIDVSAKFALKRMLARPKTQSRASEIIGGIQAGQLAGVLGDDLVAAVKLAQRLGTQRWLLVPAGKDATLVVDPADPLGTSPTIVFRNEARAKGRLDAALHDAGTTYRQWALHELVPCRPGIGSATAGVTPPVLCRVAGPTVGLSPPGQSGVTPVSFGASLPIILVPGILGSRLVEPGSSGNKVWDPTAIPFAARVDRLENGAPLAPDPTLDNIPRVIGRPSDPEVARLRAIPNFGNLVFEFYAKLVIELTDPIFQRLAAGVLGAPPSVFVAGYDWRQSNAVSATRLERVVDAALAATGAPQALIIAHSMGGLVSRWFCKFGGASRIPGMSKVCALVLVGSPSHGTPKAYRTLRFGFGPLEGLSDALFRVLFWDRPTSASQVRMFQLFPSAYELLPTQHFCTRRPRWLRFDAARAGLPDASVATITYANHHTGIGTGPIVAAGLRNRATFDASLGISTPDPTFVIFSNGLSTEATYVLRTGRAGVSLNRVRSRDNIGDGTVAALSGQAVDCRLGGGSRIRVGPVEHNVLMVDPGVISHIKRIVLNACPSVPVASPGGVLALSGRR